MSASDLSIGTTLYVGPFLFCSSGTTFMGSVGVAMTPVRPVKFTPFPVHPGKVEPLFRSHLFVEADRRWRDVDFSPAIVGGY